MIKRGVSLYSYQQNEFFHTMDWKAQLREVATNLGGADGIEIINECTIPQYPMPPESFFYEWNNEMARWGLKAVAMDVFMDTLQFRDHVMTIEECAERVKYDLRLAHKMGFKYMRLIKNTPIAAVRLALPLAEELDVCMTSEIHAPQSIRPQRGISWGENVARDVAFIQMTGTKHYRLQPDLGIFQDKPTRISVAYALRAFMSREEADEVSVQILQKFDEMEKPEFMAWAGERWPKLMEGRNPEVLFRGLCCDPLDLYSIMPYVSCVHGKFYEMTEIEGKPGQYEEKSILYPEVISILNDVGFDGYICSEYEGQRSQQDMGYENLPDEVEQVRRHHEMLARLIADDSIRFKV